MIALADETPTNTSWRDLIVSPRVDQRECAIAQLISSPDPDACPALDRCLCDAESNVRHLAVIALSELGLPALASLTRALSGEFGVMTRIAATSGVARIGPEAQAAIEALRLCLHDKSPNLRWHAGFALSQIGKASVPTLERELEDADAHVQLIAIQSLGRIGSDAQSALPRLRQFEASSNSDHRISSIAACILITGEPEDEIKPLIEMTYDPEHRLTSVTRIGELGEQGRDAKKALLDSMRQGDHASRCAAVLSLARIKAGDDETVSELGRLLNENDEPLCIHAMSALASFGSASMATIPDLERLRECGNDAVSSVAKSAIEMITSHKETE